MTKKETDFYKWENEVLNKLDIHMQYLCSILSGHVQSVNIYGLKNNKFGIYIKLNMDKNYGGNYLPISGKDMRYYVPKMNSAFDLDMIGGIEYLEKPKPIYQESKYLGQKINWNLGYDKNYFKIEVEINK